MEYKRGVGVGLTLKVGSPLVKSFVKMAVERRGKILRCVSLGEGFENVGVEPRGPSERAPKKCLKKGFSVNKVCENIRTWVPP